MTRVKRSALHRPVIVGAGAAAMATLLGMNAAAFVAGTEAPWLLGSVILADMLVIGTGILVAAREVLVAEGRTEQSEERLAAILDSAMDAIITIDEAQRIVLFNRAAEVLFKCPRSEAIGSTLERFLPERFRAAHRAHVEHFGRTGVSSRKMGDTATLFALRADGQEFPIEASISQAMEGEQRLFTVILRDISRRLQAQAEAERMQRTIDAAQARLAAIIDSAMDAMVTVDEEQKIVLFNRAAEQVFAVRREDVIGTGLERLLPARFRAAHRGHIEAFGRTGVTSRRMGDVTTLWALRAHGENEEEFPIEASISQAMEGGERYYTVILRDITLRKRAEDELRRQQQELRELSARVLEAREDEKTRIARELHDELGQLLTALKMDLGWLRERLPDPELAEKARDMGELLDKTVSSTRRISQDLRPLMLDDLGLADAAQWLVEDFAKRSGVTCDIRTPEEADFSGLSKTVSTAAYRALQESLTNIGRHSGAKSAWILLEMDEDGLHIEVEDDGRGIAPEDLTKARSTGLRGMRERMTHVGGTLEIARAPRGGTRLRLRVPLRGMLPEKAA
ncbi:MAG TPA: PAS domain-containing sensor histidine kinase [Burkholderiales bacterium]|nr:PAS domain-containing sensor histidine kinase [Burkholderiales bacterium]